MKLLLTALILINACSQAPLIDCMYYVDGICVNDSVHELDHTMIDNTVQLTQRLVNERFGVALNLPQLIEDNGLSLEVVSSGSMPGAIGRFYTYGLIDFDYDNALYPEEVHCLSDVLAHELLHFILLNYFLVPDDINLNHKRADIYGQTNSLMYDFYIIRRNECK